MKTALKLFAATAFALSASTIAQAQAQNKSMFTVWCKDYNNGEAVELEPKSVGIGCPDTSELVLQDEAGYQIRVEEPKDDGQGAGSGYQLRIQDEAGNEIDMMEPKAGGKPATLQ